MTPSKLLRWGAATLALVLSLGAFAVWRIGHWNPGDDAYPSQGVDLPWGTTRIDWQAVRAQGADFAYLPATSGAQGRDPGFAEHWPASAAAGLKRGAMHRFDPCEEASAQAENYIAYVPRDPGALPPVVLLERSAPCPRDGRGEPRLIARIEAIIRMVEAHSERPVMLRIPPDVEEATAISGAIDRPLWLERPILEPSYGRHDWVMWRANPWRRVDGVPGAVGWNVVRGK